MVPFTKVQFLSMFLSYSQSRKDTCGRCSFKLDSLVGEIVGRRVPPCGYLCVGFKGKPRTTAILMTQTWGWVGLSGSELEVSARDQPTTELLHVRPGDEITVPTIGGFHGLCPQPYQLTWLGAPNSSCAPSHVFFFGGGVRACFLEGGTRGPCSGRILGVLLTPNTERGPPPPIKSSSGSTLIRGSVESREPRPGTCPGNRMSDRISVCLWSPNPTSKRVPTKNTPGCIFRGKVAESLRLLETQGMNQPGGPNDQLDAEFPLPQR